MSGRGEGSSSNAWSRGRPVMSTPLNNTRGPPPGIARKTPRPNNERYTPPNARQPPSTNGHRFPTAPSSGNSLSKGDDLTSNPIMYNRERYLHLLLSMVGHTVIITKTNGEVLEGIFHTFCPFKNDKVKNVYVVKGVKRVSPPTTHDNNSNAGGNSGDSGNASGIIGQEFQEGSTLLLSSTHVSKLHIKSIRLDNLPNSNQEEGMFRTDGEISGQRGGTERLVAAGSVWTAAGDGGEALGIEGVSNLTLGSRGGMFKSSTNGGNWRDKPATTQGLQGTIGDWDQFSANEKRFNVKASFDENLYTTTLDYKNLDSEKMAEAERIAQEIENTVSTNIHVMEERNQKISADYDEEDLYSGVLKKKDDKVDVVETVKTMNYAAAAGALKKIDVPPATVEPVAQDAPVVKPASDADVPPAKTVDDDKKEEVVPDTNKAEDEKEQETKSEQEKEESKPKLNPNAKEFTFNPGAKSFTPSFAVSAPPPAAPPAPPAMEFPGGNTGGAMHPMMPGNYHPGMQYMHPGGPAVSGMMPVMNAQHPQMRQPYSPYGGGPAQHNMQPPTPGQEENTSISTGEGSSNPPTEAQAPNHQQQYMPGYAPPASYPGYYGGAGAMMHHPHQRPNFPPQMQVMPGYQRMYPGMMQMRGPQPYGYGHGGVPYPGGGYEEGHNKSYTRKNSKGNGGGNYKNKRNSYGGRGGKGYNYSEGRQSEDGSANQDGSGSDQQSEEKTVEAAT